MHKLIFHISRLLYLDCCCMYIYLDIHIFPCIHLALDVSLVTKRQEFPIENIIASLLINIVAESVSVGFSSYNLACYCTSAFYFDPSQRELQTNRTSSSTSNLLCIGKGSFVGRACSPVAPNSNRRVFYSTNARVGSTGANFSNDDGTSETCRDTYGRFRHGTRTTSERCQSTRVRLQSAEEDGEGTEGKGTVLSKWTSSTI